MAYSNWGAKVHVDGQAKHENCDATPAQVLGSEERYGHYLLHYLKSHQDKDYACNPLNQMYHAVVGDAESGLLICLYKSSLGPVYRLDEQGTVLDKAEVPSVWGDDWEPTCQEFSVGDISMFAEGQQYPEAVCCKFTDAKGRKWEAISGFGLGEGYEEWD